MARPYFSARQCTARPSPQVFCMDWFWHHSSIEVGKAWFDLCCWVSCESGANHGDNRSACFLACWTTAIRSSAASVRASSGVKVLPSLTQARVPATALYMQSPLPSKSFLIHFCDIASVGLLGRLWHGNLASAAAEAASVAVWVWEESSGWDWVSKAVAPRKFVALSTAAQTQFPDSCCTPECCCGSMVFVSGPGPTKNWPVGGKMMLKHGVLRFQD